MAEDTTSGNKSTECSCSSQSIWTMSINSEVCPQNSDCILKIICEILHLDEPYFALEWAKLCSDSHESFNQVTCETSGIMCSAVGRSTLIARNGSAFRMALHLTSFLEEEHVKALVDISDQRRSRFGDFDFDSTLKYLIGEAGHPDKCIQQQVADEIFTSDMHSREDNSVVSARGEEKYKDYGQQIVIDQKLDAIVSANVSKQEYEKDRISNGASVDTLPAYWAFHLSVAYKGSPSKNGTELCSELQAEARKKYEQLSKKDERQKLYELLALAGRQGTEPTCGSSAPSHSKKKVEAVTDSIDFVSKVKEYCDRHELNAAIYNCKPMMEYKQPYFEAELILDRRSVGQGNLVTSGHGRTKKLAKRIAVRQMFLIIHGLHK